MFFLTSKFVILKWESRLLYIVDLDEKKVLGESLSDLDSNSPCVALFSSVTIVSSYIHWPMALTYHFISKIQFRRYDT